MYNYTLWNSAWCTVLQKDRQKMKLSTRREEGLSVVFDGEVCMWCNFSLGPFSTAVGLVGACQLDWSDYNKIFTNKNSLTLNYRLFLLIHFGDIGINLLAPHCDHTDNFYRDVAVWVFFFPSVWGLKPMLYALGNPHPECLIWCQGCLPFQEWEHKRFLDILAELKQISQETTYALALLQSL